MTMKHEEKEEFWKEEEEESVERMQAQCEGTQKKRNETIFNPHNKKTTNIFKSMTQVVANMNRVHG